MNTKSTELGFDKEKDHPEFSRYFWKNLLYAVGATVICVIGIVFTLLNAELIDGISQVVIFAVACATFGIVRLVIWFRQKF